MLSSLRDTCEDSACHMWVLCMPHVRILHVTCEFFACHMWRCCTSLVRALSITCDDSAPHIWRCCASHGRTLHLTCKDSPHHMWGLCASHVTWRHCASHVKMLRITWEDSAPHMWRLCASHMRTLSHMWGLCVPHYYGLGGRGRSSYRVGWRRCAEQICVFGLWLEENKWSIKRCYTFVKDNSWGYWDVKLEFFSLLMCFIFTHFMGQSGLQFGPGALC